ncbi:hypothetical protein RB25_09680 [Herbaspirillum rubrisubalbicans]|uniref:DDE-type integrase/transposase/recombinase n=1 Tax=Herbaspirillum rubrisubalbicans TaxID=80842 RepID=UPI000DC5FA0D|nr:DDE-type integrase/transposase/recombinase [Herbaspirillum rubrisubalbicans]RAN48605.1 hypothetical protein RB25_09680 [Herbaspirillum rubrisubalbicans]
MLTAEELEAVMDKHGLDADARAMVYAIRQADPSRRVKSGVRNVTCRYPSKKMGMVIQAESHTCELAAVALWEHNDRVYEFYDQCPQVVIRYVDKKGVPRGHSMTPDFFVIAEDFIGWVECKAETWLEKKAQTSTVYTKHEDGWRCLGGEALAAPFKFAFKVLVDTSINQVFVRNIEFLSDFLDERCPLPDLGLVAQLSEAFEGKQAILLSELLSVNDGQLASTIYKLICDEQLFANLESELLVDVRFTRIYRSRKAAEAFRVAHEHQAAERFEAGVPTIVLQQGKGFEWDGQQWTIMNVGIQKIAIRGPGGAMQSVTQGEFLSLANRGEIVGFEPAELSLEEEAGKVVAEASTTDLAEAHARLQTLERLDDGGAYKVCSRTIRNWKAYARAGRDAYGNGFVGLIPRFKDRGNRCRRLSELVLATISKVVEDHLIGESPKTMSGAYAILCALCKDLNQTPPSRKTFGIEVNRTTTRYQRQRARLGNKGAYAQSEFVNYILEYAKPSHGDRAFEIAHVDHTQMDVQLIHSVHGTPMGKPWLTVMMDAFTRKILAHVITFDEPSYRSCMMLVRDCLKRHSRMPSTIVCDQGTEFNSRFWETLLATLHVTKKSRPPAQCRFGSVIERFFGKANTELFHQLKGNNTALQNPRSMSGSHDPRKLAVWTLPAITQAFSDYVENTYPNLTHPALGVTPNEAERTSLRSSGIRETRIWTWAPYLGLLCLPEVKGVTRRIDAGRGINFRGTYYYHPKFADPALADKRVCVKYDPFDFSVVFAKWDDEWYLCRCPAAAQLVGRTEKEIRIISMEQDALRNNPAAEAENRVKVGRNLIEISRSERQLTQQKRDAEKQAADDLLEGVAPLIGAPPPSDAPAPMDDYEIKEDDIEDYGEYE